MAHEALSRAVVAAIALGAVACAESEPGRVESPGVAQGARAASAPQWPDAIDRWTAVHSARFALSVPLPDVTTWAIDDATTSSLVATQPSTRSKVTLRLEVEPGVVNHAKCEGRARDLGLFPDEARSKTLRTVEDLVTVGPEAYDTHVLVAIEPTTPDGPIRGHVLAAGAYVRKCLFVHVETEVPNGAAESVLSSRLALARVRTLGAIRVDELGAVPREQPTFR